MPLRARDFESRASASSATPAHSVTNDVSQPPKSKTNEGPAVFICCAQLQL